MQEKDTLLRRSYSCAVIIDELQGSAKMSEGFTAPPTDMM